MGHDGSSLGSAILAAYRHRQALLTGRWIEVEEEKPCVVCDTSTKFREVGFEAPMCPGECTSKVEEEYWRDMATYMRAERLRVGR